MASSSIFHELIPFVLLLLINPSSTTAQTYHNITLGSSLSPLNGSWLSPSGDFAFGFRPLETDGTLFLLAIWFDKTANKTVVWYANGADPVQAGSRVELTSNGQLSLKDNTGQEVWNPAVSNASYAAMLDTGNLVLSSSDLTPQWQSFGSPTDTILPSQTLNLGITFLSHLMDTDYSQGRFKLAIQTDGNLVFYPMAVPTGYQYSPYWASNTVGNGTQLIFNGSGSIYLALKDRTQFSFTSGSMYSMRNFYQRGTLDPDGVFRHYIYPKNGSEDEDWTVVAFKPADVCQISTGSGSGACGFNSYCKSGGSGNQTTDCECPPQYSFLDPSRKYKGCKPDFAAQSCDADDSALFKLIEMTSVNWPFSDYEQYNPMDEDNCKSECLSDCFCAVAIYYDGNCWKKKLPLSNGMMGSYVLGVALVKVPKGNNNNSLPPSLITPGEKKIRWTWVVVGSSLFGTSVFINIILITTILLLTICPYKKSTRKLQPESSSVGLSLRCFTYKELEEATNGFSEEVGRGAFGRVYKGNLQSEPRICVAIKRLDKPLQDNEKEFTNEIRSIGQTHHKNLVRLLGFCNEGTERILVYEFMNNGTLTSFIFQGPRPDWNRRIQVMLGIARGLLYLHEECTTQIIHCDIKSQNILLDDHFVARISDFGLAKLLGADQTRTNTGIRGTRGYVAPDWFKSAGITAKVDVYSFGVILLEIICCRKNVEPDAGDDDAAILTYWSYDCYRDGRVDLLVEGDEEALADLRRVEKFVAVAIWCIQEEPSLRPTMQKVTQMLDGAVTVPSPPDPSSYISSFQ